MYVRVKQFLDIGCGTLWSNTSGFPADLVPHLKKGLALRGDFMTCQCKSARGDVWLTNRKFSCRKTTNLL